LAALTKHYTYHKFIEDHVHEGISFIVRGSTNEYDFS